MDDGDTKLFNIMKCADRECRDKIFESINKNRDEMFDHMKRKVSIQILCWAFGIIVVCGLGISGFIVNSYSNSQEIQDHAIEKNTIRVEESIKDRAIQRVRLESIGTSIDEIKETQKEIKQTQRNQQAMQQKMFEIMQEIRNDRKNLEDKVDRNLEEVKREMKALNNNLR